MKWNILDGTDCCAAILVQWTNIGKELLQTCNSKQYLYKNSKHNSNSKQYLSVMPVRQIVGVPVRQLVGVPVRQLVGVPVRQLVGLPEHQCFEKIKNIAKKNNFSFVSFRSELKLDS